MDAHSPNGKISTWLAQLDAALQAGDSAAAADLLISEFMASNDAPVPNQVLGSKDDWIEIGAFARPAFGTKSGPAVSAHSRPSLGWRSVRPCWSSVRCRTSESPFTRSALK